MSTPILWSQNIASADLGTVPTLVSDPQVLASSAQRGTLAMSVTCVGGTSPTVTVLLYFYNTVTASFEPTGDSFLLDPATANLQTLDPAGLTLAATATATGSPTSFTLHIGSR